MLRVSILCQAFYIHFLFNSHNPVSSYFYSYFTVKETEALAVLNMVICPIYQYEKLELYPGLTSQRAEGKKAVSLSGQEQYWIQLLTALISTLAYLLTFQGAPEPS